MKNAIGIDVDHAKKMIEKMNKLLANYQIYYQNLRGFHWNLQGSDFFTLHVKFEELYDQAKESIDEIAERIVTLEGRPLHTNSDYIKVADIAEEKDVTEPKETVSKTVSNLQKVIENEREVLNLADEAGDESTVDMMTEFIRFQEKTIWMLNAYNKEVKNLG